MSDWMPADSDVEWVKELVRMIKDGGTWAVPCSLSMFTFYHSKKEYVLVGDKNDPTNHKTFRILNMLGWKERRKDGDDKGGSEEGAGCDS